MRDGDSIDWVGVLVPITIALTIIGILPYLQRRGFRKRFEVESPNLTNAVMQFNGDGVRSTIAGRGEATLDWSTFSSWLEGKDVFMLMSGYTFLPIPKSALEKSQIEEVRDMLTANILRKTK
jgi:hypothetical protein